MALSNRPLSGCLEPTLASGLTDFLLVQPTVSASATPSTAISGIRRDIKPQEKSCLSPWGLGCQVADLRLNPKTCDLTPNSQPLNLLQRGLGCRSQQFLRILLWIAMAEHGVD